MENYNKIVELVENSKEEAEKFFEKGNNSAGTRLRGTFMEIIKLCKETRKDVSDIKNQRKETKNM